MAKRARICRDGHLKDQRMNEPHSDSAALEATAHCLQTLAARDNPKVMKPVR